jgi:hypothetical protein
MHKKTSTAASTAIKQHLKTGSMIKGTYNLGTNAETLWTAAKYKVTAATP